MNTVNRLKYGLWNNLHQLEWPIRFLIEWLILCVMLVTLACVLKEIGKKLRIKVYVIKGCVWMLTEVIELIGREAEWAIDVEEKILDWGKAIVEGSNIKRNTGIRNGIFLGTVVAIYFAATFVDLPFAKGIQKDYWDDLSGVKRFFQKYESVLSAGYEEYPPLFVTSKKEEELEEEAEEVMTLVEEEEMRLFLNERGKGGSNIRQEPALDAPIVGGVTGETEIWYQNQWENDGERYWIKIYLPNENVYGWISGKLIESGQLEEIISLNN